jgi:hypothetical protein
MISNPINSVEFAFLVSVMHRLPCGHLPMSHVQDLNGFLVILLTMQTKVMLARESPTHPEPHLLHPRMSSDLQIVLAQDKFGSGATGDPVKRGNLLAVVENISSPSKPPLLDLTDTQIPYQSIYYGSRQIR